MRSVAAIFVVTALFAGTLVGGLSYTGALDPDMLYGPKEDHPGVGTAGWKTHSLPAAGFSVQLPPEWTGVSPKAPVVFHERRGKKVLASLTVVPTERSSKRTKKSASVKHYEVDGHTLTFSTSPRLSASYARVFEYAAKSFRAHDSA